MFTDVLAVTPHKIKRPELITCCPSRIFRVVGVAAVYLHDSSSDMVNTFPLHSRELPKIAIFRTLTMIFCPRKRPYLLRHTSAAVVFANLNTNVQYVNVRQFTVRRVATVSLCNRQRIVKMWRKCIDFWINYHGVIIASIRACHIKMRSVYLNS